MGEWMEGWVVGWINGWMGNWMGGGGLDGWVKGSMDTWEHGWMGGRKHGPIESFMNMRAGVYMHPLGCRWHKAASQLSYSPLPHRQDARLQTMLPKCSGHKAPVVSSTLTLWNITANHRVPGWLRFCCNTVRSG